MNTVELSRALRQLRLSGMADTLDTRLVEDWGKLLGDTAAVTALLDRALHHAHVLKCGPRSWRMKDHAEGLRAAEAQG
jgi:DNA replication protein DnaC